MSEKEKQILSTLAEVIPKMKETDIFYLLGFAEGLAASINRAANDSTTDGR